MTKSFTVSGKHLNDICDYLYNNKLTMIEGYGLLFVAIIALRDRGEPECTNKELLFRFKDALDQVPWVPSVITTVNQ